MQRIKLDFIEVINSEKITSAPPKAPCVGLSFLPAQEVGLLDQGRAD